MEIGIRTDLPAPKQDAQSVLKDIHISRSLAHGVGKYLSDACTVIYIAVNDSLASYIVLADTIRSESANMVRALHALKVQPVLLTGDNQNSAAAIRKQQRKRNRKTTKGAIRGWLLSY